MAKNNDIPVLSYTDKRTVTGTLDNCTLIWTMTADMDTLITCQTIYELFIPYIPPGAESFHSDTLLPRVNDQHGFHSRKSFLGGLVSARLNDLTT